MPIYDYVCSQGHLFDGLYPEEARIVDCRMCFGGAGISDGYPRAMQAMALSGELKRGALYDSLFGDLAQLAEGKAVRVLLQAPAWKCGKAQAFDPIVIHEDRQGNIRFPGNVSAQPPNGFQRRELKTIPEALGFERKFRDQEDSRQRDKVAREDAYYAGARKANRADLRQAMKTMSPRGRAFAERTMSQMDQKHAERLVKSRRSTDFNIQVLHQDRTNREPWIDEATGWKRGRD